VLSGAMDMVVVRNKDGSMNSSSFHVRFGTLKILKAKEKIVKLFYK
jgi:phosphatidate phosphatase LPIN